ncbi:SPT2 chromatin protein [Striga asiatica]|uniref:SPT2 chromatin protein n=1 Tax=Striga asiatica TaxID=4170 RepID=A0A5A7R0Q4_STRAF|nr:SPT2 chromatin protein [Striga asiatica]
MTKNALKTAMALKDGSEIFDPGNQGNKRPKLRKRPGDPLDQQHPSSNQQIPAPAPDQQPSASNQQKPAPTSDQQPSASNQQNPAPNPEQLTRKWTFKDMVNKHRNHVELAPEDKEKDTEDEEDNM